ncbi:MAG: helix-turn-helix domain-containing protein [Nocardioides sp.]
MRRTSFASEPCSVARTVDLLGDWWTPLVLREAAYGTTRFDRFERRLGIGRNVLTQRLARLVQEGVLDRVPYQNNPVRYDYVLTEKGRDLFGILAAMLAWGDRWQQPDGPPVLLRHNSCGQDTTPRVCCSNCGEELRVGEVTPRITTGAVG